MAEKRACLTNNKILCNNIVTDTCVMAIPVYCVFFFICSVFSAHFVGIAITHLQN